MWRPGTNTSRHVCFGTWTASHEERAITHNENAFRGRTVPEKASECLESRRLCLVVGGGCGHPGFIREDGPLTLNRLSNVGLTPSAPSQIELELGLHQYEVDREPRYYDSTASLSTRDTSASEEQ